MSTYWYFECLDHTPWLTSSSEFTQHTDDSAFVRAMELANDRPIPADWADRNSLSGDYFTTNACQFLSQHPKCHLGAVDEYGNHRLLSTEPPTPATPVGQSMDGTDDPVNHPARYTSDPSGVECLEDEIKRIEGQ